VAVLTLLCAGGLALAQQAARPIESAPEAVAAAQDLPPRIAAAVFARDPEYWDPSLSPRGTQVLARTSVSGRERVVIHDLVTGQAMLLPSPTDAQIDWFEWAGEGRVLVSLGWTRTIDGEESYVTRMVVFDLATGARTAVIKPKTDVWEWYADALLKAGKPHEFVGYPDEGHGFENQDNFADWLTRLDAFLQANNPAQ
jgi:hypothetical protein